MTDESHPPTSPDPPASTSSETTGEASVWPTVRRLGPEGRYHLEERLAAGGAATVWRAYDQHLDRSVAIKILHPHLVDDEDTVRRFERESRNAARLHHPNAIQIYDSGRINDVVYLVMEFVDGPTLKAVLEDHGALGDWHVTAAIGEQIAAALSEAHAQGLIHRDIKPANILITTDGIVKVVDFGIAKALTGATADLTAEGTTVGTATYIAPEQYTGSEVDARADIYALGMVMYECLTGRPAYAGDTPTATAAARLTREILPPRQVRADIDRRLEDIIVRCTRRDPSERFGDVSAVAHALRHLNSQVEPQELTRDLVAAAPPDEPAYPEFPDVDPDAITDPGLPVGGNPNRTRMAIAFLAGIALTIVVIIAMTGGDGTLGGDTPENALTVMDAADYDPWVGDGENGDQVANAHDGEVTTFWPTESYPGGMRNIEGKLGVGVWFDVGEQPVSSVDVAFRDGGASFEVYGFDEPPPTMSQEEARTGGLVAALGDPLAEVIDADATQSLSFEERQGFQYYLVWLTRLPDASGNGSHRAEIAEVTFRGPVEPTTSPTASDPGDAG